jgi:predicted acyltransferase
VFDVLGAKSMTLRRVATAFQVVGVNAIFVFVASGVFARLLSMIKLGDSNAKDQFYHTFFVSPLGDTNLASFSFALTNIAFWWIVLWIMWKRNLSIRV